MATAAQIRANEANAQKSTGPKTAEGKARASRNAQTHGLATGILVIPAEDREAFREFEANLNADVQPKGALELETCRQIARAAWNLRRLRKLAHGLANSPDAAAQLRQLTRYRASLEMNFYRGLKTIRELQTRRAARELQLHEPEQTFYPPQLEPRFYRAMPMTRGDRLLNLEVRGLAGPGQTHRMVLDANFRPREVPLNAIQDGIPIAPSTA